MLISIALCTYNGAQYLQEQLDSIANQTRLPDELVICDDRSQDNTFEIISNFSSKAPFPVLVSLNEKNLGSTKNFEKAIGLCSGDIIFLSDQDDVWEPLKLEYIEKVFSTSSNVGAVFTDAEVVDENLKPLGYRLWQSIGFNEKKQNHFIQGKFIEVLLKRNFITGSTMAFRSEFKELFFPIPDIWVHDGWIALLIAFTSDLYLISKPLIKYRQHSMQQVGAGDEPLNLREKVSKKIDQLVNLDTNYYGFKSDCTRYMLAYEHLVNSHSFSIKKDKLQLLKSRATHFCIRSNFPVNKAKRIPIIIKELFNMNYHCYSNGISSAVGDLLRSNTKAR